MAACWTFSFRILFSASSSAIFWGSPGTIMGIGLSIGKPTGGAGFFEIEGCSFASSFATIIVIYFQDIK